MAQSLQRKINRGHIKQVFNSFTGRMDFLRKLKSGLFQKTIDPLNKRGQVYGNQYSRNAVQKMQE